MRSFQRDGETGVSLGAHLWPKCGRGSLQGGGRGWSKIETEEGPGDEQPPRRFTGIFEMGLPDD